MQVAGLIVCLSSWKTMGSIIIVQPHLSLCLLLMLLCGNAWAVRVPPNPCSAWRLSMETNNLREWSAVHSQCETYVGKYMTLGQYLMDFKEVSKQSLAYMNGLKLKGDGKEAWVFDIDGTSLSNLPYYQTIKYGGETFNEDTFKEWIMEGKAPALLDTLFLYDQLLRKGVKIFFLTGRDEAQRDVTVKNLREVGYKGWAELILRGPTDQGKTAVLYKSEKREEIVKKGYRILGNSGDQWSDITGTQVGARTFKLPNPMYYIS
eukprot:Gb_35344 [translate_table: standard]